MAKSSGCFPNLACFTKNRRKLKENLKSSIKMPTTSQFLYQGINAGTQTTIHNSKSRQLNESSWFLSKSNTPTAHKSTIAIRNNTSFIRLEKYEPIERNILKLNLKSPNISNISHTGLTSRKNNAMFMSNDSFDSFFKKFEKESPQKSYLDKIAEDNNIKSNKITEELINFEEVKTGEVKPVVTPFIFTSEKMPKIIPITPAKRRRNQHSRPFIKLNLKPYLPEFKNLDSFRRNNSQDYCKKLFEDELSSINLSIVS